MTEQKPKREHDQSTPVRDDRTFIPGRDRIVDDLEAIRHQRGTALHHVIHTQKNLKQLGLNVRHYYPKFLRQKRPQQQPTDA